MRRQNQDDLIIRFAFIDEPFEMREFRIQFNKIAEFESCFELVDYYKVTGKKLTVLNTNLEVIHAHEFEDEIEQVRFDDEFFMSY